MMRISKVLVLCLGLIASAQVGATPSTSIQFTITMSGLKGTVDGSCTAPPSTFTATLGGNAHSCTPSQGDSQCTLDFSMTRQLFDANQQTLSLAVQPQVATSHHLAYPSCSSPYHQINRVPESQIASNMATKPTWLLSAVQSMAGGATNMQTVCKQFFKATYFNGGQSFVYHEGNSSAGPMPRPGGQYAEKFQQYAEKHECSLNSVLVSCGWKADAQHDIKTLYFSPKTYCSPTKVGDGTTKSFSFSMFQSFSDVQSQVGGTGSLHRYSGGPQAAVCDRLIGPLEGQSSVQKSIRKQLVSGCASHIENQSQMANQSQFLSHVSVANVSVKLNCAYHLSQGTLSCQ